MFDLETIAVAKRSALTATDAHVDKLVRACGYGSISNYPNFSKTLRCTDLTVMPAANCSTLTNTVCTFWTDRDNNICNG